MKPMRRYWRTQKVQHKIYFDHASTTSLNHEVKESYIKLLDKYYNSDALYDDGVAIYRMQEESRVRILNLLGIKNANLIFTSGASEANSLAIKGLAFNNPNKKHLVTSIYEHASVYNSFKQLEDLFSYEVTYLKPDKDGMIGVDDIKKHIRPDTLLVSIMHVNNEIGSINDIDSIGKYIKENSQAYFHSDITQSLGKIDIPFENLDLASFSAHKIHGLKGSGALVYKNHLDLSALISGGQQEYGIRGGTSNAPTNIVLAKTVRIALEGHKKHATYVKELHDYLISKLKDLRVEINSSDRGIDNLINFSTSIKSEVLLNHFNLHGIMVSSRSTCGSRENEPSRVLKSIGVDDEYAIRISVNEENNRQEIDYFIDVLKEAIEKYG